LINNYPVRAFDHKYIQIKISEYLTIIDGEEDAPLEDIGRDFGYY